MNKKYASGIKGVGDSNYKASKDYKVKQNVQYCIYAQTYAIYLMNNNWKKKMLCVNFFETF